MSTTPTARCMPISTTRATPSASQAGPVIEMASANRTQAGLLAHDAGIVGR
jgi:hypothetical protein